MADGTFVKVYLVQPKINREVELCTALRNLAASLAALDGCLDCELLLERETANTACFIERWRSKADYEAASSQIDGELFTTLGSLLMAKPRVRDFEEIDLGFGQC